mmetsp:Transcript_10613/g.33446  ORF Transcript_10613/g.33446 Transcript_10613/m.33446 type:complete len:292 (+) Transcript_10613:216-1091(+)
MALCRLSGAARLLPKEGLRRLHLPARLRGTDGLNPLYMALRSLSTASLGSLYVAAHSRQLVAAPVLELLDLAAADVRRMILLCRPTARGDSPGDFGQMSAELLNLAAEGTLLKPPVAQRLLQPPEPAFRVGGRGQPAAAAVWPRADVAGVLLRRGSSLRPRWRRGRPACRGWRWRPGRPAGPGGAQCIDMLAEAGALLLQLAELPPDGRELLPRVAALVLELHELPSEGRKLLAAVATLVLPLLYPLPEAGQLLLHELQRLPTRAAGLRDAGAVRAGHGLELLEPTAHVPL